MDKILLKKIADTLDEKKAENIKILDVNGLTIMTDYFVITNGKNQPQIDALIDATLECLLENGIKDVKVEGGRNNSWTLIDAGNAIIHIFSKETREFYDLERIWKDGKPVYFE